MNEETKKRNKIVGISIGILVVLLVVISSTYAYWQITKSQNDSNDIIAACLDIDMQSVGGTFALDPAWPISDSEGMQLDGYTFKVTNNCPEDVNYIIGMDSLVVSGVEYLDYDSVKLSVDNNDPVIYGSQENIEHIEEDDLYQIRDSKKLYTAVVKGKVGDEPGSNTHNVKVWIKAESGLEDREKVFSGRIFITGGQKIENDKSLVIPTADACFEMDEETGTEIIGYDESCGTGVVIPATVNGVAVKTIDSNAFKNIEYNYDYGIVVESSNPIAGIVYNMEKYDELKAWADRNGMGALPFYTEEPEITGSQKIQYCEAPVDGSMPKCYDKESLLLINDTVKITGLDLSQAYNLEKIEDRAFTNVAPGTIDFENYDDYPISLTSLTFGNNDNVIEIGYGAFARIAVDELTVYTSYIGREVTNTIFNYLNNSNINGLKKEQFVSGYFSGSEIEEFIIKPTKNNTVIETANWHGFYFPLYEHINSKNVTVSEGITEIGASCLAFNSEFKYPNGKLSLPSTLNIIGDLAFEHIPYENIYIPSNVTYIGTFAFRNPQTQATITVNNSSSISANWSENWCDGSTVIYLK